MRKVTSSTFKTTIGIDYAIGVDYGAVTSYPATDIKIYDIEIDSTVQNNFEEDIKNIRWCWPYVTVKDEACADRWKIQILKSLGAARGNTPVDQIDFIIPIEYKKKSREDVSRYYGTFGALYDLAAKEDIFYKVHRKDGNIGVESDSPHNFFIKFKPEVKE